MNSELACEDYWAIQNPYFLGEFYAYVYDIQKNKNKNKNKKTNQGNSLNHLPWKGLAVTAANSMTLSPPTAQMLVTRKT